MSGGPAQPEGVNEPRARAQASQALLAGNGLPGRWAGRPQFVVLDADFGGGQHFLATWAAWRQDPQRCRRLWVIGIAPCRPAGTDPATADPASTPTGAAHPALAHALRAQWPPSTPDLHSLDFDAGQVRLLLARGDLARVLPDLLASVNAFYLGGLEPAQAPGREPARWDARLLRGLHRLAAPGATLASTCLAPALHDGLQAAGFQVQMQVQAQAQMQAQGAAGPQAPQAMTLARFAPRVTAQPPPGRLAPRWAQAGLPEVAVVGAGLAGAAAARALAAQGLAVQVFDRQPGPAGETSGNAGGLFHGIVHGHDGLHARWLRAAALRTASLLRPALQAGSVPGAIDGLLRGERLLSAPAMAALLQRQALPPDYVQVRAKALPDGRPAWFYPSGGWVAPAALCRAWLAADGIAARYGCKVQRLQPHAGRWRLLGSAGQVLTEVDAVLLCNAADAARLAGFAGAAAPTPAADAPPLPDWPLHLRRGQTTLLPAGLPGEPALPWPVADSGYVLRLADGRWLCGGVSHAEDPQPDPQADSHTDPHTDPQTNPPPSTADHQAHLATLQRLTGWATDVAPGALQGRIGWRLQADDRLPLLGALPDRSAPAGPRRQDQPRWVPRQAGLYVFTALGSRGITQAALGGEILACHLSGAPQPAPASLLDALDPARFIARAVRAGPG